MHEERETGLRTVRRMAASACGRRTVRGWKNCGSRWLEGRAFDILTDEKGERMIEIKNRKEVLLVPWESLAGE